MADNQNSKSGTFINDPAHWRDRAQKMRVLAEDMNDEYSKAAMLHIAEEYEGLQSVPSSAHLASCRLSSQHKSGISEVLSSARTPVG